MIHYPLSQNEQRVVEWFGRAVMFTAAAMTFLLGAISWVA